jgi:cold shock CspA family protein
MAETWNKKEREKKTQQNKKQKEEKRLERKEQPKSKSLDDMLAYVDENGNLSSTPPDPRKMQSVRAEDISIGVTRNRPEDDEDPVRSGTITFFNESKGYGFIKDSKSRESVFVHVNALKDPVKENSRVLYEVENTHKGPSALNVRLAPAE